MELDQRLVRCKLATNLRPVKLAYLIEDGDTEALRHVMECACTDWGGMRNFIIPIGKDGGIQKYFRPLLTTHPPDFYFHYLPKISPTTADPFARCQSALSNLFEIHRTFPVVDGRAMESDFGVHPLSVVPDFLLDSPARVRPFADFPRKLTVFNYPNDGDRIYLLALFGQIFPGHEKDYAANTLISERDISINDESFWKEQTVGHPTHSPLELTTTTVAPTLISGGFPTNLPFLLVLASDCSMLAWFWNIRAVRDAIQFDRIGRRTILVPPRLATDAVAIGKLVAFIRTAVHIETETCNLDFMVASRDKAEADQFAAILAEIPGLEKLDENVQHEYWFGREDRSPREADPNRVLTYLFCMPQLPISFTEGAGTARAKRNVSLRYGAEEIEFEPPPNFVNRFNGMAVIDLQTDLWDRYPRSPSVAKAVMPNAWWSHYGISFRTIPPARAAQLPISILDHWEAYRLYFSDYGYDVSRSQSATYAGAVIELVGGIAKTDIFARPLVYGLLQKLTLPSTKKLAQRLAKMGVEVVDDEALSRLLVDAEAIQELKKMPKSAQQLSDAVRRPLKSVLSALHSLSEVGALRRGFHLPCPRCGTPSWHWMTGLDEHLRCPGCFFRFHLPVESPPGSELAWHYSLNAMVNRAMDQDGMPAILALNYLAKAGPIYASIPGIELRVSGSNDATVEFDFILVRDAKLLAGECKAGTELSEKDFRSADLAATLGFAEYFFCTPLEFSDSTRSRIEDLRAAMGKKMQVRTLQRAELLVDP